MNKLEECKCPICHKRGEISIKSKFLYAEKKRIAFYAKCYECGYESHDFDSMNEVIKSTTA